MRDFMGLGLKHEEHMRRKIMGDIKKLKSMAGRIRIELAGYQYFFSGYCDNTLMNEIEYIDSVLAEEKRLRSNSLPLHIEGEDNLPLIPTLKDELTS